MALAVIIGIAWLVLLNLRVMTAPLIDGYVLIVVITLVYASVGVLLAARVPRNPIGWILCGLGLSLGFSAFFEQYGVRGLVTHPGSLPAVRWVVSLSAGTQVLMLAPIALVFLLFPDGSVPSRRWRPVLWVAIGVIVVGSVGQLLQRGYAVTGITNSLESSHQKPLVTTAFGVLPSRGAYSVLLGAVALMGALTWVLSVTALFVRRRRASTEQRQQLAWLAYVGATVAVLVVVNIFVGLATGGNSALGTVLFVVTFAVLLLGVPTACGIAILKYRLYDLDIVVKKTVVIGILVALATAVYTAVVIGVGAAIGHRGNAALTFAAAALVAIAFQPVRIRARRLADRIVYGKRASPYELLSEFSERMAVGYSTEDVLPRMARLLVEGTGAERAEVWLRLGDAFRLEAWWPTTGSEGERQDASVTLRTSEVGVLDDGARRRAFPVEHQGERLGILAVASSPSEPVSPAGERLVRGLAAQAGLVLRNVLLIEDLKSSRKRIVEAQDEERRRIERNIHDGAQQQLVALRVRLKLVSRV